jgi:hypothetical protein
VDATPGPWWQKALVRGYMSAELAGVEGGNWIRGFEFGFAGSALNSIYTDYARHSPGWGSGQSYPNVKVDCALAESNCYVPIYPGGYIPEADWSKNTWGFNEEWLDNGTWHDCLVQSGPCSRFMDAIPGQQAVSQLHDTWMNNLSKGWNVPTMPIAAVVTYGSLIGTNVYNITPWLNIRWPTYREPR